MLLWARTCPFPKGSWALCGRCRFNLSNTPAFQNPDAGLDDGNFGQINSVRQQSQRLLQLSLRFTF